EFIKNAAVLGSGLLLPGIQRHFISDRSQMYDLVIYGASSAGIIAGIAAAGKGLDVIIVEPSDHIGGLTSGGLGQTDIGVEGEGGAIGGMSFDFYRRVRQHYMKDDSWNYQTWNEYMERSTRLRCNSEGMFGCEPKVARMIYEEMSREAGLIVVLNERIRLDGKGVDKRGDKIVAMVMESGNVYQGKMFIDATYESDLMAMAGVTYVVGREGNQKYDEQLNGV